MDELDLDMDSTLQFKHKGLDIYKFPYEPPTARKLSLQNRRPPPTSTFSRVLKQKEQMLDNLVAFSGWSRPWVENLWIYCTSITPADSNTIPRIVFNREMAFMFGIANFAITERTFDVYRRFSPEKILDPQSMFKGVVTMLSDNLEQKIDYVFDMHDYNADGSISFDEIAISLEDSLVVDDYDVREEGSNSKAILEIVRKTLKLNQEGILNRHDFRTRVYENSLLLEVLGPCLPSSSHKKKFMELISPERLSCTDLRKELAERHKVTGNAMLLNSDSHNYYPFHLVMPSTEDLKRMGKKIES